MDNLLLSQQGTENTLSALETKRQLFALIQMLALKQDVSMERTLKPFEVTTKQWFLHVLLLNGFSEPPTLKALAEAMSTSYQNVKQMALKLEEKGLLALQKDDKDARVTRVVLTDQSESFWKQVEGPANAYFEAFFKDISDEALTVTLKTMNQFMVNIETMGRDL